MDDFSAVLARARAGDSAAFEALHHAFADRVLATVRRDLSPLLRRRYDTMDLAQSVFVEVLRDLPRFEDRGEGPFVRWLQLKAENKVRQKLRRSLRPSGGPREVALGETAERSLAARSAGPDGAAGEDEDRRLDAARAQALLCELDPVQQDVVRLHDQEGLTFRQVAERLGLPSEDAARMRHARALLALRKRWKQNGSS
jgi:RNA polymerase sigma-70 factor, ECF subfamily